MSQSLVRLYIHIVFHINNKQLGILQKDKKDLFAYIGSIIKDNESSPIIINGTTDHIHVFCVMSKNIALAKLVEEIKRHSSRWIKTKDRYYENFAWQGGYGCFSVSPSLYDKTKTYIKNQEEHHKQMTFHQEYIMFLERYGIEYNEKYLWND